MITEEKRRTDVDIAPAGRQLFDLVDADDPYAVSNEEILPLQLAAAQERFAQMRQAIPLLNQRAEKAQVERIETLADVVPLLFSHTVYKSYPQSFVTKGRWDRLLAWFESLSVASGEGADLDGVKNIDDFAAALTHAGFIPYITSGTSGKVSILNSAVADRQRAARIGARLIGWPRPVREVGRVRYYGLSPSRGYSKHVESSKDAAAALGRPGSVRFLTDEPMLPSQASRAAAMRVRMADGSATPDEIDAFHAEARERSERHSHNLRELAADIIEHRGEPMIVMGLWSQHWAIMEQARKAGVGDGEFHPDSLIYTGGGLKGIELPPDYRRQLYDFYGDTRRFQAYGMAEIDPTAPMCEADRYHRPPWVMWLVLDQAGEQLAAAEDGVLDGRFAALSMLFEGRWGGLITGDHVRMDLGTCDCGRPGPTIFDDVRRYSEEQGGDDKIGCAGSMEAYVRGMAGA
jgi:hypothetical protein